jgi:hypothetical protein
MDRSLRSALWAADLWSAEKQTVEFTFCFPTGTILHKHSSTDFEIHSTLAQIRIREFILELEGPMSWNCIRQLTGVMGSHPSCTITIHCIIA